MYNNIMEMIGGSLLDLGWSYVCKENSYLMTKNDLIFSCHSCKEPLENSRKFDYHNYSKEDIQDAFLNNKTLNKVTTVVPYNMIGTVKSGWHIEYKGWLIDKGPLDSSYLDLDLENPDNCNTALLQKYNDFITRINKYSVMSRNYIESIKTHAVEQETSTCIFHPVDVDDAIHEGSLFRNKNTQISSIFKLDNVYLFHSSFTQDGVSRVIIKTMNVTQNKVRKVKDIILEARIFFSLLERPDVLQSVKLEQEITDTIETVWLGTGVEHITTELPSDFRDLAISVKQSDLLLKAYSENLNYFSLLTPKDENILDSLMLFIEDGIEVPANLNNELLNKLVTYRQVIDMSKTFEDLNSVTYLDEELKEFDTSFNAQSLSLSKAGFSEDAINYLKYINFYEPINDYIKEGPKPAISLKLVYAMKQQGHNLLYRALQQFGSIAESSIYMQIEPTSGYESMLHYVKAFYSLDLKTNFKFKDSTWNEYIDKILNSKITLEFQDKLGLCLSLGYNYLVKTKNSFIFYDIYLKPIWQAMYINDKWYINREHEMEISI